MEKDLLTLLKQRGFVHQCTDEAALGQKLAGGSLKVYGGFDCTGPYLHVGSQVSLMLLHWLQAYGHQPVLVLGGGTTRIGDPSGKDAARPLLSPETIEANKQSLQRVFNRFVSFEGACPALVLDNYDWLGSLGYLDLLRDIGTHFTINRMLSFDSVRLRLERQSPLSLLEFNYMVMQAYDFDYLANNYDVGLQIGGADQWGNIVNGVELIRRRRGREVYGLTTPLLTTANGKKMGKTEQGAVWLDKDGFSPFDFWQFWRNVDDSDVGRFLRLFTRRPLEEIEALEALEGEARNKAKEILANDATAIVHGKEAALAAQGAALGLFGAHTADDGNLPRFFCRLEPDDFFLYQAIVLAGFESSNGAARRLIKAGGARLNGEVVADEGYRLTARDIQAGRILLSAGKKRHALLIPETDRS